MCPDLKVVDFLSCAASFRKHHLQLPKQKVEGLQPVFFGDKAVAQPVQQVGMSFQLALASS